MSSNHRSLQDSSSTLPGSTGDRDFEIDFDAPGLTSSTNNVTRPYISYRANPGSDASVRVQMELNSVEIVDQTLDSTVSRQLNEIFDHGVLRSTGNTLRVFVPTTQPARSPCPT